MSKTSLILAAGFAVALTAAPAVAQNGPSYEDRGYGGPLYVGPNFHEGGQYNHPIYGSGSYHSPSSSDHRAPTSSESRVRQRSVNRSRDDDTHEAPTRGATRDVKPSETKTNTADSENSSIAAPTQPTAQPKDNTPAEAAPTQQATTTENSSIAVLASRTDTAEVAKPKDDVKVKADTAADSKPVGCTKYFPTVGLTLSVACDPK